MILGGTNLAVFNFVATQQPNSNISLKGICDLPKRLGKTYHSWPEKNSVEPYVLAEEIKMGGRDLQLIGIVKDDNAALKEANTASIIALPDSFDDLVNLETSYGDYEVYVKDIQTTFLSKNANLLTINLRQPLVPMSNDVPTSDAALHGIDGISFKKLGGGLLKVGGDFRNRPALKEQFFTAYKNEGYQIVKTVAPILDIEMYIEGTSWADFKSKIDGLQALLKSAGTRVLSVPSNTDREFFVTEGFTVSNIIVRDNYCFGFVNIKGIEIYGL